MSVRSGCTQARLCERQPVCSRWGGAQFPPGAPPPPLPSFRRKNGASSGLLSGGRGATEVYWWPGGQRLLPTDLCPATLPGGVLLQWTALRALSAQNPQVVLRLSRWHLLALWL